MALLSKQTRLSDFKAPAAAGGPPAEERLRLLPITADALTKDFGPVRAVADVSFEVGPRCAPQVTSRGSAQMRTAAAKTPR
jgi:hypothetical protein